jgi:hypothetical protein
MILAGQKKYELRLADFDIEEGDILRLEEYTKNGWTGDKEKREPTGRFIEKKVTFVRKTNLKDWVDLQPELLEKGFYTIQFE